MNPDNHNWDLLVCALKGSEPTKFRMRTSFRNVAGATCCKWP